MRPLFVLALAALLAAACAPAATPADTPAPGRDSRVIATGGTVDVYLAPDRTSAEVTVNAPPARVWEAVRDTYTALGIPMGTSDPRAMTYGNQKIVVRRRLADAPLSRFLNCGHTAAGAPVADTYRVTLSLLTTVHPAPGGASRVTTRLGASAESIDGSSSNVVACGSTGVLETRIGEGVQSRARS